MKICCRTALAPLCIAVLGLAAPAVAQTAHPIPYHELSEHQTTLARLNSLAAESGAVGTAAKHVLAVLVPHDQSEEAFVLPLLGLVDALVDGKVGPDMAWAIPMADRVVAERAKLYDEHSAIIAAAIELKGAGEARGDAGIVAFATAVAEDEVNDGELVYPQAILVGMVVRDKLAAK